jgi:hypothetical protein
MIRVDTPPRSNYDLAGLPELPPGVSPFSLTMSGTPISGDDICSFCDDRGSWRVQHFDEHGWVRIPFNL